MVQMTILVKITLFRTDFSIRGTKMDHMVHFDPFWPFRSANSTLAIPENRIHKLREAKPGGFKPGCFPLFFGNGPDCVADPFGTVPRRC